MSPYDPFKERVLAQSQDLTHKGYLFGTGGNVSHRIEGEEALAITPSGRDYLGLTADDICVYSFTRQRLAGELKPSVEMGMHIAVYQARPDVNAIVHTHQPFASLFTILNKPIPALFEEQVMQLGDQVVVVPYARSGTDELGRALAAHLGNRCHAYLLQNHGVVCLGITLAQAAINAQVLEKCARVYYYALTSGQPITLLQPDSTQYYFDLLQQEQQQELDRQRATL